jgi:DNA-binding MarR family transcriptional regulator
MNQPHFDIQGMTNPPASAEGSVGEFLVRAAACLTALLQGPTATAGLNESRYNVLDALRRTAGGTSTQTELAARLLQSESNLSTLLERMRQDGLISRERSETDRRKSLIGLTRAGRDALARADLARSRAMATVFKTLEESEQAGLRTALWVLLQQFEGQLGIAARVNSPVAPPTTSRIASPAAAMTSEHRSFQGTSLISDGLTS